MPPRHISLPLPDLQPFPTPPPSDCELANHPPNATGYYPSLQACSHNPRCFAPGSKTVSYECHGAHLGCVPKSGPPDGKTTFATIDLCEQMCHVVPPGMAFGCAGSRPAGCVLLAHAPDPKDHYYSGIEDCTDWCTYPPGAAVAAVEA